jgi:(p)ppGpp synthase/HD superfamily hydrolase
VSKFQSAENFAKERHLCMTRREGVTLFYEHLGAVVARLKNLGITDVDVLSAAWLHDILDETETSFDELDQRFGSKVAVIVMAISMDRNLPRTKQEEQYIKQLRESSLETKLIKLCDISANLRDLKNAPVSKKKKTKEVKKNLFYLNVIKKDLIKNKLQIPGIVSLINGINDVILAYGLRSIILQ